MKNTLSIEIDEKQIPSVIQESFAMLADLKNEMEQAAKKAEEAVNSANKAKNTKVGAISSNKKPIEALQAATVDLADAISTNIEADELSFKYQQTLSEITKYLFALGVSSIAKNRSIVKELQLKLENASEEELDEMALKEVTAVIEQLKAQQDTEIKCENLRKRVGEHDITLKNLEQEHITYRNKLKSEITKCTAELSEADTKLDHKINDYRNKLFAINKEVDGKIKDCVNHLSESDKTLENKIKDSAKALSEEDKRLENKIDNCTNTLSATDKDLERKIEDCKKQLSDVNNALESKIKDCKNQLSNANNALESKIEDCKKQLSDVNNALESKIEDCKKQLSDTNNALEIKINEKLSDMSEIIAELKKSNDEKNLQIQELKDICEKLSKALSDSNANLENTKAEMLSLLSEKASKKQVITAYIAAAAGIIAAIIRFFI